MRGSKPQFESSEQAGAEVAGPGFGCGAQGRAGPGRTGGKAGRQGAGQITMPLAEARGDPVSQAS